MERPALTETPETPYAEFVASPEQPCALYKDALTRLAVREWREAGAICERIDLTNAQKTLSLMRVEAPDSVVDSTEQTFEHLRQASLQLQHLAHLLQQGVVSTEEMPAVEKLLSDQRVFGSRLEALPAAVVAGCRDSLQGYAAIQAPPVRRRHASRTRLRSGENLARSDICRLSCARPR
ncbi:hypothetical protein [Streptomyces sp. NPDC001750]|uniref:hypothetical protein n=1 Tax=unclassified Streptomyces TaxID=2593676 RepID=UPI00367780A3